MTMRLRLSCGHKLVLRAKVPLVISVAVILVVVANQSRPTTKELEVTRIFAATLYGRDSYFFDNDGTTLVAPRPRRVGLGAVARPPLRGHHARRRPAQDKSPNIPVRRVEPHSTAPKRKLRPTPPG